MRSSEVPDMTRHGQKDSISGSAANQGRGVVEEAKGMAREVLDQARAAGSAVSRQASGLGSTIKQGLTDQVEQQKNGIADRIGAIAERAQRNAEELSQDEPWLGSLLGRGGRELGDMAADIRDNDVTSIIGSVGVFAERQPALFMGAAVALGFALTRVVRPRPTTGSYRTHPPQQSSAGLGTSSLSYGKRGSSADWQP
jgi:gas vesicle protein